MFLAEARGLATLRCCNIATILGLGLTEEPLLVVTEAGDMGDLNMFLQVSESQPFFHFKILYITQVTLGSEIVIKWLKNPDRHWIESNGVG